MPEPNVNLANEIEIDRWKKLSIRSKFSADAVFGGKETFERLRNLIYGDEKKRKEDEKADIDELDVRNLFMVYCLSRDDTTPSIVYHADKRLLDKWLADFEKEMSAHLLYGQHLSVRDEMENRKWYGRMFGRTFQKLLQVRLPEADSFQSCEDISKGIEGEAIFYDMVSTGLNYALPVELSTDDTFIKEVNGVVNYKKATRFLSAGAEMVGWGIHALKPDQSLSERVLFKLVAEIEFAPELGGTNIGEKKYSNAKELHKLVLYNSGFRAGLDKKVFGTLSMEEANLLLNVPFERIRLERPLLYNNVLEEMKKVFPEARRFHALKAYKEGMELDAALRKAEEIADNREREREIREIERVKTSFAEKTAYDKGNVEKAAPLRRKLLDFSEKVSQDVPEALSKLSFCQEDKIHKDMKLQFEGYAHELEKSEKIFDEIFEPLWAAQKELFLHPDNQYHVKELFERFRFVLKDGTILDPNALYQHLGSEGNVTPAVGKALVLGMMARPDVRVEYSPLIYRKDGSWHIGYDSIDIAHNDVTYLGEKKNRLNAEAYEKMDAASVEHSRKAMEDTLKKNQENFERNERERADRAKRRQMEQKKAEDSLLLPVGGKQITEKELIDTAMANGFIKDNNEKKLFGHLITAFREYRRLMGPVDYKDENNSVTSAFKVIYAYKTDEKKPAAGMMKTLETVEGVISRVLDGEKNYSLKLSGASREALKIVNAMQGRYRDQAEYENREEIAPEKKKAWMEAGNWHEDYEDLMVHFYYARFDKSGKMIKPLATDIDSLMEEREKQEDRFRKRRRNIANYDDAQIQNDADVQVQNDQEVKKRHSKDRIVELAGLMKKIPAEQRTESHQRILDAAAKIEREKETETELFDIRATWDMVSGEAIRAILRLRDALDGDQGNLLFYKNLKNGTDPQYPGKKSRDDDFKYKLAGSMLRQARAIAEKAADSKEKTDALREIEKAMENNRPYERCGEDREQILKMSEENFDEIKKAAEGIKAPDQAPTKLRACVDAMKVFAGNKADLKDVKFNYGYLMEHDAGLNPKVDLDRKFFFSNLFQMNDAICAYLDTVTEWNDFSKKCVDILNLTEPQRALGYKDKMIQRVVNREKADLKDPFILNQDRITAITGAINKLEKDRERLLAEGKEQKAQEKEKVIFTYSLKRAERIRDLEVLEAERDHKDNADRLAYEKAAAEHRYARAGMEIYDGKRHLMSNAEYQKVRVEMSLALSTAESDLHNTDHFYAERKKVYEESLNAVLRDKGVDPNSEAAKQTVVTIEEVTAKKAELFPGREYSVFGSDDMAVEMEERLMATSPKAKMILEMMDTIYRYRDDLGGSRYYKDTDKPRLSPKAQTIIKNGKKIVAEMKVANAGAMLRKGKKLGNNKVEDYPTNYEATSMYLHSFLKLAVYEEYLTKKLKEDEQKINGEIGASFKDSNPKPNDRKRIHDMYKDSYRAFCYMTRFYPHYQENGPAYYSQAVIPSVLKNLIDQYNYAKQLGTDEAMTGFFKEIDGACFDLVCRNIQDYAEAHPIPDPEMDEVYRIADPGHGGVYVHDARHLKGITVWNQFNPQKCDTALDATMKVIGALTQEYTDEHPGEESPYRWKDVEKEVRHQLAGKHFRDVDFSGKTEQQLGTEPDFVKVFAELKKTCIDWMVINEDEPEPEIKPQEQEIKPQEQEVKPQEQEIKPAAEQVIKMPYIDMDRILGIRTEDGRNMFSRILDKAGILKEAKNRLQDPKLITIFAIYCLSEEKMSPEDFARIDTFSIEEQQDLGQRFLKAFRDHPYSEDRKQTIENAGWYGKMCATAVGKLKEPGAAGLAVYIGEHIDDVFSSWTKVATLEGFLTGYGTVAGKNGVTAFDEDRTFLYEAKVHDRQQDDKAQGKGKAIDRITEAQQLFEVAVGKFDGSRPYEQGKIQDLRALTGEELDQSEEAFDRLFANLALKEKTVLDVTGSSGLLAGFRVRNWYGDGGEFGGDVSVSSVVNVLLGDKALTEAERIRYEKAYIMRLAASADWGALAYGGLELVQEGEKLTAKVSSGIYKVYDLKERIEKRRQVLAKRSERKKQKALENERKEDQKAENYTRKEARNEVEFYEQLADQEKERAKKFKGYRPKEDKVPTFEEAYNRLWQERLDRVAKEKEEKRQKKEAENLSLREEFVSWFAKYGWDSKEDKAFFGKLYDGLYTEGAYEAPADAMQDFIDHLKILGKPAGTREDNPEAYHRVDRIFNELLLAMNMTDAANRTPQFEDAVQAVNTYKQVYSTKVQEEPVKEEPEKKEPEKKEPEKIEPVKEGLVKEEPQKEEFKENRKGDGKKQEVPEKQDPNVIQHQEVHEEQLPQPAEHEKERADYAVFRSNLRQYEIWRENFTARVDAWVKELKHTVPELSAEQQNAQPNGNQQDLQQQNAQQRLYTQFEMMFEGLKKLSETLKKDQSTESEIMNAMTVAYNRSKLYAESSKTKAKQTRPGAPDYIVEGYRIAAGAETTILNEAAKQQIVRGWVSGSAHGIEVNGTLQNASLAGLRIAGNAFAERVGVNGNAAIENEATVQKQDEQLDLYARDVMKIITDIAGKIDRKVDEKHLYLGQEHYLKPIENMTVKQCAQEVVARKYIGLLLGNEALTTGNAGNIPNYLEQARQHFKDHFSAEVEKLENNAAFKAVAKAYPDDFTNRWNEVKEDADALQKEYQEKYNAYGEGGFMNFVRAEGAGDAEKYQRLAQVIIAQVFSQPKNIKALQGIVAGQYDLMDTQNKILDYVTASRCLEGTNFNAERLEQDIATGRLRDKVLKNVVDKQKPAKLKKVLKNPHEMGMI